MFHTIVLQAAPPMSQGLSTGLMIVLMVVVFWLLVWRPQSKERERLEDVRKKLKAGDDVITASGIFGKVVRVEDRVVTLEVSKGNKIKILLSQIQGLQSAILQAEKEENKP